MMMLRSVVGLSAALATACFSEKTAGNDANTTHTVSGDTGPSSSTLTTGVTTGDPGSSSEVPTTTIDPDGTSTAGTSTAGTSTAGTSTTGSATMCGDGVIEVGELCPGETAVWSRDMGHPIVDVAVGTLDDNPGDGAVIMQDGEVTFARWWWWNGEGGGPQVTEVPMALALASTAVSVHIGDLDGVGHEETILLTDISWTRSRSVEFDLDPPCLVANGINSGTLAQLDGDPGLELALAPANTGYLEAWLDPGLVDNTCVASTDDQLISKPTNLMSGGFHGVGLDDVILTSGMNVLVGQTDAPSFGFGPLTMWGLAPDASLKVVGRLVGTDFRDDFLAATPDGLAVFARNGDAFDVTLSDVGLGVIADLAVGDLDGDGDDDALAADSVSDVVAILVNADGVLTYRAGPATAATNTAVAIADLDGDGASDIIVADDEGHVLAFLADP